MYLLLTHFYEMRTLQKTDRRIIFEEDKRHIYQRQQRQEIRSVL